MDTAVKIFEVTNGTYETELEGGYEIMFDAKGAVHSINTDDGRTALLTTEQKFDETAYAEATAKYEYEKVVYDKEQDILNKQTEIYQRQDKQLALKLTRLDTERNALNTEIEAVKKVIQDAVEGGFKTFSG